MYNSFPNEVWIFALFHFLYGNQTTTILLLKQIVSKIICYETNFMHLFILYIFKALLRIYWFTLIIFIELLMFEIEVSALFIMLCSYWWAWDDMDASLNGFSLNSFSYVIVILCSIKLNRIKFESTFIYN